LTPHDGVILRRSDICLNLFCGPGWEEMAVIRVAGVKGERMDRWDARWPLMQMALAH